MDGFRQPQCSARGIRLPFDNARVLWFDDASGPRVDLVKTAVARVGSNYPYLLFGKFGWFEPTRATAVFTRSNLGPLASSNQRTRALSKGNRIPLAEALRLPKTVHVILGAYPSVFSNRRSPNAADLRPGQVFLFAISNELYQNLTIFAANT